MAVTLMIPVSSFCERYHDENFFVTMAIYILHITRAFHLRMR